MNKHDLYYTKIPYLILILIHLVLWMYLCFFIREQPSGSQAAQQEHHPGRVPGLSQHPRRQPRPSSRTALRRLHVPRPQGPAGSAGDLHCCPPGQEAWLLSRQPQLLLQKRPPPQQRTVRSSTEVQTNGNVTLQRLNAVTSDQCFLYTRVWYKKTSSTVPKPGSLKPDLILSSTWINPDHEDMSLERLTETESNSLNIIKVVFI